MTMTIRPHRSVLFMPGTNKRALEKGRTLAADALIFDLEDAVAPEAKATARKQVADAIAAGGYGAREIVVRVNALDTPWGRDDVLMAAKAAPDAVLIPKVTCAGDIMHAAKVLREAGAPPHTRLWAMLETPLAVLNADLILRTAGDPASRLDVAVMGTNDLAKETRARLTPGRPTMIAWLSMCVLAARAHSVEILDGVFNDFADRAGFRAECEQGRDLGMDGKTLIHPDQIGPCNDIFAPPPEELAWASKVISVFAAPENVEKGVVQVEGRMVERLHEQMAQRTVALAEAIAAMA